MSALLHPGFADPVRDSQAVFRAVLDAMARPGRTYSIAALSDPPPPLDRATAAVMLCLLDSETPLWMDDHALASHAWVTFHCGASLTQAAQARFAVACGAASLGCFARGTDEEPESSATLILQLASLGEGQSFRLKGPGLAAPTILTASGLGSRFVMEWHANHRLFPRGIDVILCAGDKIAALPRTLAMEPA